MFFKKILAKALFAALPVLMLAMTGCGGGASDSSGSLALTATAPADSSQPGTATATYTAADGKNPLGVEISFSTDSPYVALDSTKQSVGSDGNATITFRTIPSSTDVQAKIIATTGGLSQFQLITIKAVAGAAPITPPSVSATPNSIAFNQAQPTNITLKGMGGAGLVETSIVSFIVKDSADKPLANQTVDFALNTTVGGLAITPTSAVSDANGIVQTIVSSGIVATPVRVTATVRGTSPAISVQSDQLVVSTGIPAQDGFSISVSNLNSESWNHDGVTVDVTARLSDHFHNPVPDGTAVYFTTSGGSIQPSCTTVGGACKVEWTSQSPRPLVQDSNGAPIYYTGRPVILAYAVGEESFTDANGNGVADAGACSPVTITGIGQAQQCGEFIDTPEAFRDDNMNGVRDAGEPFIDFNGDGVYNAPDSLYEGVLRPTSVSPLVPKTKHVFSNTQIVMSSDAAKITAVDSYGNSSITAPGELYVTVTDVNGNTMASGTKISVSVPFGTVSGATSYTVPQNIGFGVTLPVYIAAGSTPKAQAGLIEIDVTSSGGLVTKKWVSISGSF